MTETDKKNKLKQFVEFAHDIAEGPIYTFKQFDTVATALGITALLHSNTAYGGNHAYTVHQLTNITDQFPPLETKNARFLEIDMYDTLSGAVVIPRFEKETVKETQNSQYPFESKHYDNLPLICDGPEFGSIDKGAIRLPSAPQSFNAQRFFLSVSTPLEKSLTIPEEYDHYAMEHRKQLIDQLVASYRLPRVNMGKIQFLEEKMYECLAYNLFYALHANLKNPVYANEIKQEKARSFVLDELIQEKLT